MSRSLGVFTKQLVECRRRWNHRSLDYVLESARILGEAREAAKSERRWVRWLREGPRMSRATALKHERVANLWGRNVSLRKHFETLSISKIYALSRAKPVVVHRLAADARVHDMPDAEFSLFIRQYLPRAHRKAAVPNLYACIMAGLDRVGQGIARWKSSRQAIPRDFRIQIQFRIRGLMAQAGHLRTSRRRAL
jgi:hypothetical protein